MCMRAPGQYFLECVCWGEGVRGRVETYSNNWARAEDGFQERIYETSEKSETQSRGNRPGFWCNLILLSRFLHPSLVPSILEGTNCNGVSCSSGYFSRVLGKRW